MKTRTAFRASTIALVLAVAGCFASAQPVAAQTINPHRFCNTKAEFAVTVAAMHQSGIPLRTVLRETEPALHQMVRTTYELSAMTRRGDGAERAAAVGQLVYVACMVGN